MMKYLLFFGISQTGVVQPRAWPASAPFWAGAHPGSKPKHSGPGVVKPAPNRRGKGSATDALVRAENRKDHPVPYVVKSE